MTTTTTPANTATAAPTPAQSRELTPLGRGRLTLRALFDKQKPELLQLLPKGMDVDRFYRMALTECVKNPKLLECSAESWALAMQTCAAQGLYPDSGLGYMYLIPSNNSKKTRDAQGVERWTKVMEVRAQRGYQGDIKLARNTGEVAAISAEVVYARDTYRVTKGLDPDIEHVPYDGDEDPGPLKACYAVAKLASGEVVFVALTKRDVMRHKASAQGTDDKDSPWKKHEAAMWRKTAIRELFKWLPKSSDQAEQVARAIASDDLPPVRTIDTTALHLGDVPLPAAPVPAGSALDQVADSLEAGAAATGCDHADVPTSIPPGQTATCQKCGEVFEGPPGREPGSDDVAPDPVDAVKAVAAAAAAQEGQSRTGKAEPTRATGRQGRLTE